MPNYVISLGGSLIVPDQIDVTFLKKFKELILKFVKRGDKFIIVCGGGKTSRRYVSALNEITAVTAVDKDWLGIQATWLNAKFVQLIFKKYAYCKIITEIDKMPKKIKEPIVVAGGWKPGCSTDYDAVLLAEKFGVKKIVNLTDIDYVYDKDPNKFKDAKPFKNLKWKEYKNLIGGKWVAGLSLPFDPIASKRAEQQNYSVIILNGSKLKNLNNFLLQKNFIGTEISKH